MDRHPPTSGSALRRAAAALVAALALALWLPAAGLGHDAPAATPPGTAAPEVVSTAPVVPPEDDETAPPEEPAATVIAPPPAEEIAPAPPATADAPPVPAPDATVSWAHPTPPPPPPPPPPPCLPGPPVVKPPAVKPPVVKPPVVKPPVEKPPVETPPVVTPPETPPVVAPPVVPVAPQPVAAVPAAPVPAAPVPTQVVVAAPKPVPHLQVTKRGPRSVRAGGTARFRIRIANDGEADAHSIRVADVLPAGFSLIRAGSPGVRLAGGRPTWQVARVRAGHSRTLYVQVRVAGTLRGGRCNRATVRAGDAGVAGARACLRITARLPEERAVAVTG